MKLRKLTTSLILAGLTFASSTLMAADYVIDTKGAHASIKFRIQHLGYSWLYGRFNDFDGKFSYDEAAPEKASVEVNIKTASVDSNHAERDKHLRSDDFLNVDKYPEAKFVSTGYSPGKVGKGTVKGNLTLHGITKPLEIDVQFIGAGKDPWGGYRSGFEGTTKFSRTDFGIMKNLGPKSNDVEMTLSVEGIRQ